MVIFFLTFVLSRIGLVLAATDAANSAECWDIDDMYARIQIAKSYPETLAKGISAGEWRKLDDSGVLPIQKRPDALSVFDAVELVVIHPLSRFVSWRRIWPRLPSGIRVSLELDDLEQSFPVAELFDTRASRFLSHLPSESANLRRFLDDSSDEVCLFKFLNLNIFND